MYSGFNGKASKARSAGPLENALLAGVLVAAGIGVAAVWTIRAVRARRRLRRSGPHRIARRLALGGIVAVLLLTGTAMAVNSYAGYVPTVSALAEGA